MVERTRTYSGSHRLGDLSAVLWRPRGSLSRAAPLPDRVEHPGRGTCSEWVRDKVSLRCAGLQAFLARGPRLFRLVRKLS
jgi:hypothetical protein